MRIVYPVLWARPDRQACRQQTMATIAALARRGHEITLLLPQGEGDPDISKRDLSDYFAIEGDFRVIQRRSRWQGDALARTLLWLRQVARDRELAGTDLLYSRIPAMLAFGAICPIPFATDHYRPWPDVFRVSRLPIRRTAKLERCLGLVLHSAYAAAAYARIGVDPAKLLVAHNGVEPASTSHLSCKDARGQLGLPVDRPTVVYAGRVNAHKGLDQVLAMAQLAPDTLFLIVGSEGDGPVEQAARSLANVRIIPWQAPADLSVWLAAADVLIVPPSSDPLEVFRNCVLPIKLFGYLAAGRPILAPRAPDTAELLRCGENALLIPPGDPAAGVAGIARIINNAALARHLSEGALAQARNLTWDHRAEKIEAFLQPRLAALGGKRTS